MEPVTIVLRRMWVADRYIDHELLLLTLLSLSHTMLITCTCCDDQIKGTQDKDFSYSFSDSHSDGCRTAVSHTVVSLTLLSHSLLFLELTAAMHVVLLLVASGDVSQR